MQKKSVGQMLCHAAISLSVLRVCVGTQNKPDSEISLIKLQTRCWVSQIGAKQLEIYHKP